MLSDSGPLDRRVMGIVAAAAAGLAIVSLVLIRSSEPLRSSEPPLPIPDLRIDVWREGDGWRIQELTYVYPWGPAPPIVGPGAPRAGVAVEIDPSGGVNGSSVRNFVRDMRALGPESFQGAATGQLEVRIFFRDTLSPERAEALMLASSVRPSRAEWRTDQPGSREAVVPASGTMFDVRAVERVVNAPRIDRGFEPIALVGIEEVVATISLEQWRRLWDAPEVLLVDTSAGLAVVEARARGNTTLQPEDVIPAFVHPVWARGEGADSD